MCSLYRHKEHIVLPREVGGHTIRPIRRRMSEHPHPRRQKWDPRFVVTRRRRRRRTRTSIRAPHARTHINPVAMSRAHATVAAPARCAARCAPRTAARSPCAVKKAKTSSNGRGGGVRARAVFAQGGGASGAGEDPDAPTPGFASIASALEDIARGKFVVVLDSEDRENEGDLIAAADKVTAESMAFMIRHTSGLVCVSMEDDRADALDLPLMVDSKANKDAMKTAFTVSVDLAASTTGISAGERAATINALGDDNTTAGAFVRPGHVFPLRARPGGVLKRAGHTEAAVDLSRMAGSTPVGVLCEIVKDSDGSMARLPDLEVFAKAHGLKLVLISDMIRYRRAREKLVERTAVARLPTEWGNFTCVSYTSMLDGIEHVALVYGDFDETNINEAIGDDMLVRVHSECLTGDIFKSARCDCGNQLDLAMERVAKEGQGCIVYLRGQEGRGIGLGHKLRAYNLQDEGRDTVQANEDLGFPADTREYGIGAQILQDLGVKTLRLMTNNPAKYHGLSGYGLSVTGRVPLFAPITMENKRYIDTKRLKMGHLFEDAATEAELTS